MKPYPTVTAAIADRYGPPEVVRLRDVPRPVCGDGDVLIDTAFSTVSSADTRIRAARAPRGFGLLIRAAFGVTRPRQPVFGTELSGTIAAVGQDVTAFKPGDQVFAFPGSRMGAHATVVAMPATGRIALLPKGISLEQGAALCFGGTTALAYLRDKVHLQPGESVLVVGATGVVGSAAVQIALAFGASVTGVCSAATIPLLRTLGVVDSIDYRVQELTALRDRFDVVFDTTGTVGYATHRHLLTPSGRMALLVADLPQMLAALRGGRRVAMGPSAETPALMQALAGLATRGDYAPLIGHKVAFADIAKAHALADAGDKRGSILIAFDQR
jgi:NADPH:quinone reductase-like Zn-dependent oxidoreductase